MNKSITKKGLEEMLRSLFKNKIDSPEQFRLKLRKAYQQHGLAPIPYQQLIFLLKKYRLNGRIKGTAAENYLKKRAVRTLSGVTPIAVLTKPYPCPGKCSYCPNQKQVPKSYLNNEPAVMRAILCKYSPYQQVKHRMQALEDNGHHTDKIELIIMGGTWSYLPKKYQTWFIKRCFDALNGKNLQGLEAAQKYNEQAKHRCVGLVLETRPDYIDSDEIIRMRKLGCTRVEIGVQSLDDDVLKKVNRGHGTKEIIKATRQLKEAGLKVTYHYMAGLPGATPASDLKNFKKLFACSDYQPDFIKIYPCVIIKGSKLYQDWRKGTYHPYTEQQLKKLLIKMKLAVPYYVRIIRLIRDIPSTSIEAGNKISNLRKMLQEELEKSKRSCRCIRCREAKYQVPKKNKIRLFKISYQASQGTEYFLSYEDKDRKTLFSFLRLRLSKKSDEKILAEFPALKGCALIRELHTYGQTVPIKKNSKRAVQHLGLGKKLMKKAEGIAKKQGFNKIAVISGVGVRRYYQKLGYKLSNTYMLKILK